MKAQAVKQKKEVHMNKLINQIFQILVLHLQFQIRVQIQILLVEL